MQIFPITSAKINQNISEQKSGGNIIIVDINGSGDYTSIQKAIDSASSGDTIYVWNGTYYENVIIDKKLTLIGNGTNSTTIDGKQSETSVIYVSANWVNISNFNVINSSENNLFKYGTGIELNNVENVTIYNNTCQKNECGIFLINSNSSTIKNNTTTVAVPNRPPVIELLMFFFFAAFS